MGPYLLDLIATYDALTALIVGLQVVQLQKTTEKNQVPHPPQTHQIGSKRTQTGNVKSDFGLSFRVRGVPPTPPRGGLESPP
jgi:hypothetical protein